MFTMDAIYPVSDFSRKPAEHIKRLKATGKPEILTVNGKAEIVIQDAKAYEEMVDLLETLKKIATAAKAHDEGKGIPADEFFEKFEQKHGLKGEAIQD
ncbi:MAG: type II toxin-antitoxin system Phd/YefM family antitoxin [Moorea sp. SIOASIH]|uniref:type II toxin-antitoxin system Phd/YefM family antitoxin n=1 Tax=Moorena sp. SIOASIH TaxID=2607817 RepID=UPI0013BD5F82|nr:type II toxin-antitoxin system Phd/YefM family antitoxin [Moorena sp. SIOASIH]NEO36617.1 type II toxin-antitoxin system Phd/YefM family antitoxin [Moorena sp. SIOASIH]